MSKSNYLVIGAGAWGTALALHLARNKRSVLLWTRDADHADALEKDRENRRYLPTFSFPTSLHISRNLLHDLHRVEKILIAVPSHAFRETLEYCINDYPSEAGVLWASKGMDPQTHLPLGSVVEEFFAQNRPQALLTGPSFALEVARNEPTEVNLATNNLSFAQEVAKDFNSPRFKSSITEDLLGAEIGGAVKNVISICVGIADGLGYGMNTKAMLMNKGLFEMQRFAEALGAKKSTLLGPCGLGDLILTCSDNQSRNRRFGVMIGKGESALEAFEKIGQVVEGVKTAEILTLLANKNGIHAPICEALNEFLKHPTQAQKLIETLLYTHPT